MEAETDVKSVRVDLKCPDCELVLFFIIFVENKYKYKCSRCNSYFDTEKEYPYYKYISNKNLTGLNQSNKN